MLLNLTPHTIVLRDANGGDTHIPSSGVARVSTVTSEEFQNLDGVPVPVFGPDAFGAVVGLPPAEHGVFCVVAAPVGSALLGSGRKDVLVLGTGPGDGAIRDEGGQVVAVTRLKRIR